MTERTKPKIVFVSVRLPASLVKTLDRAAEQACRTRTAELRLRLESSLRGKSMAEGR